MCGLGASAPKEAMRIATLTFAAAAVVLSAASAHAQSSGQGVAGFGGSHHRRGSSKKVEIPTQKADEKGYKAALDHLPDKKYDAWLGVR